MACHLFLDVATSFGTSLFYPFSDRDFTLDLLFMFDLWILGIMLVSILFTLLMPTRRNTIARCALVLVAAYIVLAGYGRHQALTGLETVPGPNPQAVHTGKVEISPDGTIHYQGAPHE